MKPISIKIREVPVNGNYFGVNTFAVTLVDSRVATTCKQIGRVKDLERYAELTGYSTERVTEKDAHLTSRQLKSKMERFTTKKVQKVSAHYT
ncbi:hypothetical protein [Rhodohalobacter sulfatireducens]|uniref:Phage protein n=1 Tax=Rhodohalobacter sulfatireducens TaxID=2911366 RepID=A0ABS9KAE1_9BACT|nr:hypothetical protein [Rhodohalobacter sulfatireducens]MCG2587782.1 hypothetical protein [Rhodohalobacter sulfatireducens]